MQVWVCADIFSSLATLDLVTVIQGLGQRKTCQRHGLVVEKYTLILGNGEMAGEGKVLCISIAALQANFFKKSPFGVL